MRLIFGFFWLIDALLKWQLMLHGLNFTALIPSSVEGQPAIISSWMAFWAGLVKATPDFTIVIASLETIIAAFILLGFLTKVTSLFGMVFSFLIWSTAEDFGGIFTSGAIDIGASPLYVAMFAGLIVVQAGREHALDAWILRRVPRLNFLL